MANDKVSRNSQSEPANTDKRTTPSSVSMRVGRNTVEVDPDALKRLIDTLRARLSSRSESA
jgi:hypothetical protein